jgi:hypothetical protein
MSVKVTARWVEICAIDTVARSMTVGERTKYHGDDRIFGGSDRSSVKLAFFGFSPKPYARYLAWPSHPSHLLSPSSTTSLTANAVADDTSRSVWSDVGINLHQHSIARVRTTFEHR